MILKETKLIVADNSGGLKSKCIHIYKPQANQLGNFIKTVLYRLDAKKKLAKKKKYLSLIITAKRKNKRKNGNFIKFDNNRSLVHLEEDKFLGTRIQGPIAKELTNKLSEAQFKKYKSLASSVV